MRLSAFSFSRVSFLGIATLAALPRAAYTDTSVFSYTGANEARHSPLDCRLLAGKIG